MTTVAQFIEYLKILPPEIEVRVLELYDGSWSQLSKMVDLDITKYSDNCMAYGASNTLYLGKN